VKKILIADDNPAILDALKIMLEDEGYDVDTTEDGAVAQRMTEPLPDLLLLDVWMSGIDGRDVCRILKSAPKTKNVPIVIMSATKDIAQIAHNAGADNYISKPFQMEHLLETVALHLGQNK
jgi:DNA-binding response OmpR family regulator